MTTFDNIIIGAGPGGYELAARLAAKGETVLIVEKDKLGGTCLNRGCIPTKCLVATAEAAHTINESASLGIEASGFKINFETAYNRMKQVVEGLREGVAAELSKCTVIYGEAKLQSNKTILVDDETFEASSRIIIATGSTPAVLPIEGAELAMTSDDVLNMSVLPQSVIIIGGGVIGMEFATILSNLGVKTTVVEFCKEILPPFDPEVAKRLRMSLSRKGVDIVTRAAVTSIKSSHDGMLQVTYSGKRGESQIEASQVIMAVGRKPVIPVGVSEAGIELTHKGFIKVNERMETSVPGIYAIGDVNGLMMLAHAAIAQGRVVADGNPELFDSNRVPSIVFTNPEVASVGLTPAGLEDKGISFKTEKRMFAGNGKAQAMGKPEGFIKFAILPEFSNQIAGVTIIGAHAADLIAEATMLVTDKVSIDDVDSRYIHAHPTLSEMF